uniref:Uncharacterized protein n=1 Tax=Brassica oleracea var. oleracea TaxID=109376 RepID=A0A0D3DNN4_BRAOL
MLRSFPDTLSHVVPDSEAIVRALDRFELSISQLKVAALQNFLGVLILSYELGLDLSPDDFEGLWGIHQMPRDDSSVFSMFESMAHPSRRTVSPCSVANGTFIVYPPRDPQGPVEDRNFVSEDLLLPGWNPGFTPGDGRGTSEAPLPDEFFANLPPGFTTPASLDEASRREVVAEGSWLINKGMQVFNSTLDGSFREARLSHFKAEEIERKFIRFQNEVAERERRQAESHSRALIRTERKGRRATAAELARRATLFDNADFSFLSEVAEMSGLMDGCAQAKSMVPPIEGRIRELWEPIEVSEDTTEAGADAADKGGEVDQPAYSFGASISGYLDLDL